MKKALKSIYILFFFLSSCAGEWVYVETYPGKKRKKVYVSKKEKMSKQHEEEEDTEKLIPSVDDAISAINNATTSIRNTTTQKNVGATNPSQSFNSEDSLKAKIYQQFWSTDGKELKAISDSLYDCAKIIKEEKQALLDNHSLVQSESASTQSVFDLTEEQKLRRTIIKELIVRFNKLFRKMKMTSSYKYLRLIDSVSNIEIKYVEVDFENNSSNLTPLSKRNLEVLGNNIRGTLQGIDQYIDDLNFDKSKKVKFTIYFYGYCDTERFWKNKKNKEPYHDNDINHPLEKKMQEKLAKRLSLSRAETTKEFVIAKLGNAYNYMSIDAEVRGLGFEKPDINRNYEPYLEPNGTPDADRRICKVFFQISVLD